MPLRPDEVGTVNQFQKLLMSLSCLSDLTAAMPLLPERLRIHLPSRPPRRIGRDLRPRAPPAITAKNGIHLIAVGGERQQDCTIKQVSGRGVKPAIRAGRSLPARHLQMMSQDARQQAGSGHV